MSAKSLVARRTRAVRRLLVVLGGGALAWAIAGACGGAADRGAAPAARTGSIKVDTDRFPHALHTGSNAIIRGYLGRGLDCTDCHKKAAVIAGELARPGLDQHAPCDACHKDEFYKPPGAFCRVCHTDVDPRLKGPAHLQPYPDRGLKKQLGSRFSHAAHLDRGAMEDAVGFHVSCGDCHERDKASRDPMLPGHKQCARCHTEQKRAKAALDMGNCKACHPQRDVDLTRGRIFITGDLIFAHADHEHDVSGQQIPCATCHEDISRSRAAEEVSVPPMQRCAICHEDSHRTPARVRIAQCGVCHREITSGTAPSNHMIGQGLPEDHTIEFRHNHGEQAADKNANCRFCHEGLSTTSRDSCFQCHQTMKPRDHDLGWRDDGHGREAANDADRCATCHQADYCTACHSQPPRSHQPYEEFRLGGHAEAARYDLTSCYACHTFQDTCSDCHRGQR